MRSIKAVHTAVPAPIDDLITFRALPTQKIPMDRMNPFIFLNHHGPQVYPPHNNGLPFGPHPHRGMETITFILDGDIMHKDTGGYQSIISAGGIQWMTAGKGLIHAETSSEEFKEKGGPLEILQLWLNLPAVHKMMDPYYKGANKEDIPQLISDDGKVILNLVSGNMNGSEGVFKSVSDIFLCTIEFRSGGRIEFNIPMQNVIFFYVVRGKVTVNRKEAAGLQLVEFNNNDEPVSISSARDSVVILGHAKTLKEPIVAQGPFVMNSEEEIMEAYEDYRLGKFGRWQE